MHNNTDRGTGDDGRRLRGRILLAIAAVVVLGGVIGNFVIDRRADQHMERLRTDLATSFAETTSADFVPLWEADVVNLQGESTFLPALVTDAGVSPDQAEVDGDVVRARYGFDALGQGERCIRVTWTTAGPEFDEGTGRQCSAFSLE